MKKSEVFNKLLQVKGNIQVIKDYGDRLDGIDNVTVAQYDIQDIMTEIIDDLLLCMYQSSDNDLKQITDEIYTTYIPGEDKTVVWYCIYLNGEIILSQITGWYYGEPDPESTTRFGKSNTTATYFE